MYFGGDYFKSSLLFQFWDIFNSDSCIPNRAYSLDNPFRIPAAVDYLRNDLRTFAHAGVSQIYIAFFFSVFLYFSS